jgi:hypothetical protein
MKSQRRESLFSRIGATIAKQEVKQTAIVGKKHKPALSTVIEEPVVAKPYLPPKRDLTIPSSNPNRVFYGLTESDAGGIAFDLYGTGPEAPRRRY